MTISESTNEWKAARDAAVRLLDDGSVSSAIDTLTDVADADPSGESRALLGLALFRSERYAEAADAYRAAIETDPDNPDWVAMRELATNNAVAEVHIEVPDLRYFDRDELLGPPQIAPGTLPQPIAFYRRNPLRAIPTAIGNGVGYVAGHLMHGTAHLWGRLAGYRDKVWTNWYRRPQYRAILTLAFMRDKLNRDNLMSTYPAGSKIGFQPDGLTPPEGVTHFRTADGSWNNLADPKEGAAGTRFPRNVTNDAIRPAEDADLLTPNPRVISRELLRRNGEMKEVPFLNLLAAAWIQFENHDWITHGENLSREVIEVPFPDDDPARSRYHQTKMFMGRTQPDPTRLDFGEETPLTFVNEVTHWWDGSQIYGSDQVTQDRLRSHVDGKLRITDGGTLPLDAKGIELTGMTRNWWVGLAMLHTLFAREHNAICDELKRSYPTWDDNRLFNVARLVNAAVMAKIHTVEWTPAILPNEVLDIALHANWYGILTYRLRKPAHRKTLADINVRNPELGGVVGNPIDKHGSPYGLTEEFVEVYRLHSLLPETLRFRNHRNGGEVEELAFPASRQAGSAKVTERIGMADLFYSFGKQHPGQLVLNNYPRFMQELSVPGNPVFDMGVVDIVRARERGVPRYNEFRRQLGLNPITSFSDLTDDPDQVRKLEEVYGTGTEGVEKLDLMVGTLAEGTRPTHFGFGETMFQIFILNATRRLQSDRFYTTDYRPEVYTPEGLDWIDKADLKHVILRHFPELASTGLANVRNAFEPWDQEPRLDPDRHPLRAYAAELKHDPWKGDAAMGSGLKGAENDTFRKHAADIQKVQKKVAERSDGTIRRAQHVKMHAGVTNATFRVSDDLPPDLTAGIFTAGSSYQAAVRISNAAGLSQPDTEPDLRGLAFRVSSEADGRERVNDFLMTNAPISHARNADQFMAFTKANTSKSKLVMAVRLLLAIGPRETLRMLGNLRKASSRDVASVATETYWSRVPFRLGEHAVRFQLRPAPSTSMEAVGGSQRGPNYLREEMVSRLNEGPVVFDFLVQRFVDERRTPIEDGASDWPEAVAPPVKIATLEIPRQDLATAESVAVQATVDAMGFNPWNGSENFEPLGPLNRARRPVYAASQDLRWGKRPE